MKQTVLKNLCSEQSCSAAIYLFKSLFFWADLPRCTQGWQSVNGSLQKSLQHHLSRNLSVLLNY